VKVALANNPKTPVSLAVSIVTQLQKKELQALTRNRNIPSVVNEAAVRLFRQKYRQG
jgi:seryl-tRNA(Sec) selenium transferase